MSLTEMQGTVNCRSVSKSSTGTVSTAYTSNQRVFEDGFQIPTLSDFDQVSQATSSDSWNMPESSVIFVDWDNTLFPTTWLEAKPGFQMWWEGHLEAHEILTEEEALQLQALDHAARGFIVAACQLGKVCCVTLAKTHWLERTMEAFLPRLAKAWKELGVETYYACGSKVQVDTRSRVDDEEWSIVEREVFARKKMLSMQKALRRFYGKQGSWKNVLSFGDGPYERKALQDLGFEHSNPESCKTGEEKPFRAKTIKLMEEQDCEQIRDTLQLLQAWLPKMVFWPRDFDMDLGEDSDGHDTWLEDA